MITIFSVEMAATSIARSKLASLVILKERPAQVLVETKSWLMTSSVILQLQEPDVPLIAKLSSTGNVIELPELALKDAELQISGSKDVVTIRTSKTVTDATNTVWLRPDGNVTLVVTAKESVETELSQVMRNVRMEMDV